MSSNKNVNNSNRVTSTKVNAIQNDTQPENIFMKNTTEFIKQEFKFFEIDDITAMSQSDLDDFHLGDDRLLEDIIYEYLRTPEGEAWFKDQTGVTTDEHEYLYDPDNSFFLTEDGYDVLDAFAELIETIIENERDKNKENNAPSNFKLMNKSKIKFNTLKTEFLVDFSLLDQYKRYLTKDFELPEGETEKEHNVMRKAAAGPLIQMLAFGSESGKPQADNLLDKYNGLVSGTLYFEDLESDNLKNDLKKTAYNHNLPQAPVAYSRTSPNRPKVGTVITDSVSEDGIKLVDTIFNNRKNLFNTILEKEMVPNEWDSNRDYLKYVAQTEIEQYKKTLEDVRANKTLFDTSKSVQKNIDQWEKVIKILSK